MKTHLITLLLFLACYSSILGQEPLTNHQQALVKNIPQEQIYVHFNSNFLITGDRLLYKVYTLNKKTKSLSNLSKIAYVSIINNTKDVVLQQKIKLTNGVGFNDFFINKTLASGNYKIIAYTQWMQNKNYFFEDDLFIYNAFTAPPKTSNATTANKSLDKINSYAKRSKVILQINRLLPENVQGNFSISIKKKSPAEFPSKLTSQLFSTQQEQANLATTTNRFYIPEFRGELISGIVASTVNKNIENLKVILSSKHKNGVSKITSTNQKGEFHFNLTKSIAKENLTIQLDVPVVSNYQIAMLKKPELDFSALTFSPLTSSNHINNIIKTKSIQLQIENAYSTIKQDSIHLDSYNFESYQQAPLTFVLDKYKRFNTMEETIIEVIQSCWIENKKGNYAIYVRDENLVNNRLFKPLIMIDGHVITDHNELANFHPRKIKAIHVFRKKYILNSKQYHGIIQVETFDLSFNPIKANLFKVAMINLSKEKTYYKQDYSKTKHARIPDYRTQLYWHPNLNTKEIEFYTSDVRGIFEINVEGFTSNGSPISLQRYFKVE